MRKSMTLGRVLASLAVVSGWCLALPQALAGPRARALPAAPAPSPAPPVSAEPGTATLALAEALRLYRADAPPAPEEPTPPVDATLDRMELVARLLDDAAQVKIHVEATVLRAGAWVTLPLLELDAGASVAELPALDGAVLLRRGGELCLLASRPARHAFDLELLVPAERAGRTRRVRLGARLATLARLRVQLDEDLFRLLGPAGERGPEGVLLHPEGDAFAITWERLVEAGREERRARSPSIEPTVPRASASVVSTLEGRRIWRVRYQLRFAGTRPIDVTLPEGLVLKTVYLNGSAIPPGSGRELRIEVTPPRAGEEGGTLELVLEEEAGAYSLSGRLRFVLPRLSWPVGELQVDLHLPQVFNYAWRGGSLAPVEATAPAAYTHAVPLPGKLISFHQDLISSSQPEVEVSYDIDLSGSYFR